MGIYDNEINMKIIQYALYLCEDCSVFSLNIHNSISEHVHGILKHIDLLIICLEDYSIFINSTLFIQKPLFIISKNKIKETNFQAIDQNEILDTYVFSNFKKEFDFNTPIIPNVRLRLQLIQKINHILYGKLHMKDIHRSSCGIDRPSTECGDESDY